MKKLRPEVRDTLITLIAFLVAEMCFIFFLITFIKKAIANSHNIQLASTAIVGSGITLGCAIVMGIMMITELVTLAEKVKRYGNPPTS